MISDYPGAGLAPAQYDLLSLCVPAESRADEASAMTTRWWDYRGLHPAEATYLYAELYRRACVGWAESYNDLASAEQARAFTPSDIFKSRDLVPMWLSRQLADKIGAPYEFTLATARSRAFARGYVSMPRPNQLYTEDFELDLKFAWDTDQALHIRTASVPAMRASAERRGRQWHLYREWLIKRVQARGSSHRLIARLMAEDQLDPDTVGAHFGLDALQQARAYQAVLSPQGEPVSVSQR